MLSKRCSRTSGFDPQPIVSSISAFLLDGRRAGARMSSAFRWLTTFTVSVCLLTAACSQPPTPVLDSRNPPTLSAPATYQDVQNAITLDNVSQIKYVGRLTQPDTPGTLFTYALSPDGTRLVGANASLLLGWNLVDGALLFQTSRQDVTTLYYSPDKTEVYGVTTDGHVLIFAPDTGAVKKTFEGVGDFSGVTAFDSFNDRIAVGGRDGTVKVWDPVEQVSLATINAHSAPVTALAFSPDGDLIASASGDGMVRLHRWSDRMLVAERRIDRATQLTSLAFSPIGDRLALSTEFNAVMWLVSTADQVVGLETGQGGANLLLTFSPDGRFLLAGNSTIGLTLWDIEGGVLAARLPNTLGTHVAAAFAPDASMLVSTVLDTGVTLWNLSRVTSQTVDQATLDVSTKRISGVAWTDDGRLLLLFDAGGAVYLWGLPEQQ